MQEKNSTSHPFGARLKIWGKTAFGSLRGCADKLGISPQHLSAYINGDRRPTFDTICEIRRLGADLNFLVDGSSTLGVSGHEAQSNFPPLALQAAMTLLALPPEALADQLEASPKQIQEWMDKKAAPSPRQLGLLFNMVAIAGVASRNSSFSHSASIQSLHKETHDRELRHAVWNGNCVAVDFSRNEKSR